MAGEKMPCIREGCDATANVQLVRRGKDTKWMCSACHRAWLAHIDKTLEDFVSESKIKDQ